VYSKHDPGAFDIQFKQLHVDAHSNAHARIPSGHSLHTKSPARQAALFKPSTAAAVYIPMGHMHCVDTTAPVVPFVVRPAAHWVHAKSPILVLYVSTGQGAHSPSEPLVRPALHAVNSRIPRPVTFPTIVASPLVSCKFKMSAHITRSRVLWPKQIPYAIQGNQQAQVKPFSCRAHALHNTRIAEVSCCH
jgi:hypothetical protein